MLTKLLFVFKLFVVVVVETDYVFLIFKLLSLLELNSPKVCV